MRGTLEKSPCKCPSLRRQKAHPVSHVSGRMHCNGSRLLHSDGSLEARPASFLKYPGSIGTGVGFGGESSSEGNERVGMSGLAQSAMPGKRQDIETTRETLGAGDFSAGSLEPTKALKRRDNGRRRAALSLSNPLGEMPMPRTSGWQTVPLGDAPKSAPEVDGQGRSRSDDAKVAVMHPESSPALAVGEPPLRSVAETGVRNAEGDVLTAKETIGGADTRAAPTKDMLPALVDSAAVATGTPHTEKMVSEEVAIAKTPKFDPLLPRPKAR